MSRVALLSALLVGCFDPHPQAGAPCSSEGTCPRPLMCIDQVCVASAVDAGGDTAPPDADLTCACTGGTLTCAGSTTTCSLGCVAAAPAHCARIIPSNGVDPAWADSLTADIVLDGIVTFDGSTGQISGGFTRAPGTGTIAGVGFIDHSFDGHPIGVFVFHSLTVEAELTLTGTRPIAVLVGTNASLKGTIDGSAGCTTMQSCAGPGGQWGTKIGDAITGCGGGLGNTIADGSDGGGGGGGNGSAGARGGFGGAGTVAGGAGGNTSCSTSSLEPLVGGGGGGAGGRGTTTVANHGGGGGGAFQLTVLGTFQMDGEIGMNGAGGDGGGLAANSAAGAGGGAGGAIIVEAADVKFRGALYANGGGGGGGGEGDVDAAGQPGHDGQFSALRATGGAGGATSAGAGGAGAAGLLPPVVGGDGADTTNGGGGGGGVGRIMIREPSPSSAGGTSSPPVKLVVITTK